MREAAAELTVGRLQTLHAVSVLQPTGCPIAALLLAHTSRKEQSRQHSLSALRQLVSHSVQAAAECSAWTAHTDTLTSLARCFNTLFAPEPDTPPSYCPAHSLLHFHSIPHLDLHSSHPSSLPCFVSSIMRVLLLSACVVLPVLSLLSVVRAASYCPSVPQQCSVPLTSAGYDIRGNDLYAFSPQAEFLQPACAAQCCADANCQAFVYGTAPNDLTPNCPKGRACCWLKSAAGPIVSSTNAVTAATYDAGSHKCPMPSMYAGYDLAGGDLLDFDTSDTGIDAGRCSRACCATAGCVAFVVGATPYSEQAAGRVSAALVKAAAGSADVSLAACSSNKACCWLKSAVPQLDPRPAHLHRCSRRYRQQRFLPRRRLAAQHRPGQQRPHRLPSARLCTRQSACRHMRRRLLCHLRLSSVHCGHLPQRQHDRLPAGEAVLLAEVCGGQRGGGGGQRVHVGCAGLTGWGGGGGGRWQWQWRWR